MKKSVVWQILICLLLLTLVLASCAPKMATKITIPNPAPMRPVPPGLLPVPVAGKQTRPLMEYPQVVLGKDNWLFSGDPINELINNEGLDDAQIERCIEELSYISDNLRGRGFDFVFLLVPDKNLIYPEFMPDTYNDRNIISAYERFSKALSKTDIDFIDTKTILLEKKKETGYRLYYMRDVNWNSLGNLYIIQEILARLGKKHSVPQFELLSVLTSQSRVCDSSNGNDLNDLLETLFPWQEKGAPEPVYNVLPEPEAPPILWYGSCFSPEVIDMMKGGWTNSITYVPLWTQFRLPLSLRQDINQRLDGHKIVVFEIAEHYRQSLKATLVPAPPEVDLTAYTQYYNWQLSNFSQDWKSEEEFDLELQDQAVLVKVKDSEPAPYFYTAAPLLLEPSRKYYLVIKITSTAINGISFEFSTTVNGEYLDTGQGRYIYKGDNTVVFEIPDQEVQPVKGIRINLGDKAGVYCISQIAVYSTPQ